MVVVKWESGCENFSDIESAKVFAKFMLEFEIGGIEVYDVATNKCIKL